MNNGNIVWQRCLNCGIIKKPSYHLGECVALTTGNVNKSWGATLPTLINLITKNKLIMDKTFAFIMIGFFVLCASLITWGMMEGKKRNPLCVFMAWCYTAFTWACVIALIVITFIYKDL